VNARITLADGTTRQGDLIIAANGVHSTAREAVGVTDDSITTETGWASMRWLLPTSELLADPEIANLVEKSTQRFYMGAQGGGLVWYQCRE
jgi:salicylate hydroxylase